MNLKERFKKLIEEFTLDTTIQEVEAAVNLASAKLSDGTEVESEGDDFLVGGLLLVMTPDGKVPAETNDYNLEDGRILIVVDGVIVEIKSMDEPMESAIDSELMAEEVVSKFEITEEDFNSLISLIEKLTEENKNIRNEFSDIKKLTEEYIQAPATENTTDAFAKQNAPTEKQLRTERFLRIKQMIGE